MGHPAVMIQGGASGAKAPSFGGRVWSGWSCEPQRTPQLRQKEAV